MFKYVQGYIICKKTMVGVGGVLLDDEQGKQMGLGEKIKKKGRGGSQKEEETIEICPFLWVQNWFFGKGRGGGGDNMIHLHNIYACKYVLNIFSYIKSCLEKALKPCPICDDFNVDLHHVFFKHKAGFVTYVLSDKNWKFLSTAHFN